MQYALLGDLHSDYKQTKKVLHHINHIAPNATILGLGDLFECKIGKKKALKLTETLPLKEAAIVKKKFQKLLTFPSIIGNQEERIAQVTRLNKFLDYPETIDIDHATLIHGHQFNWSETYEMIGHPTFQTPLVFFGHSHRAAIYDGYTRLPIVYGQTYAVSDKSYFINVGPVVECDDWLLYDSELRTVTFFNANDL
ncbi:MAG: metallophosphoesterase family protein [Lysinibacillus sp.]